jgi:ubiquitin carboxyl-terminal hydrolase 36/42
MMDLLVDIQGNVKSVEDVLAQFTDTELLDGANKYECDQYVLLMCSGNILRV